MTSQNPADPPARILNRIASSPSFVQWPQGCVGGKAATRGAHNPFFIAFLAGFTGIERLGRPPRQSSWNIRRRLTFSGHQLSRRMTMFGWALTFLIVALI